MENYKVTYKVQGWDWQQPNRNGRIYSRKLVESAIEQCAKPIYVTLDTPPYENSVDIIKICGTVIEFDFQQDAVVAEIAISDTPIGKVLSTLFESGVKLELVSCGTGFVASDGTISDYSLLCLAFVSVGSKSI
jgi:hypothetical protein